MRWLELAAGYDCNLRCVGCFSRDAAAHQQMDSRQAVEWLRRGRQQGARHFWFGGGEPTLRRDFLPLLKAARQLGYERIKVQTNGLLFAYPELVERAVAAGMTETNLMLRSVDPAVHDAQVGRDGAHALLAQAIEHLRGKVRLEGDVLVTTPTVDTLPQLVSHYAALGLERFSVWLFSAAEPTLSPLVPRLADLGPRLVEARERALAAGATLVSLHTPHCAVPPEAWDVQFAPARMELFVVNPGGRAFYLHESQMEQANWVEACKTCAARGPCRGVRPDYLAVHGAGDAKPFAAARIAGFNPSGSTLD